LTTGEYFFIIGITFAAVVLLTIIRPMAVYHFQGGAATDSAPFHIR